jgi:hypothetical protein
VFAIKYHQCPMCYNSHFGANIIAVFVISKFNSTKSNKSGSTVTKTPS